MGRRKASVWVPLELREEVVQVPTGQLAELEELVSLEQVERTMQSMPSEVAAGV
jgi:hypothetical protein